MSISQQIKVIRDKNPGALTLKVTEAIRSQIADGKLKPGQYVISERDLSQLIKVSRVTVRRGLDILVKESVLEKEPGKGYYYPGTFGDLKGMESKNAVLFMHSEDEFHINTDSRLTKIWSGARKAANKCGLFTIIQPAVDKKITDDHVKSIANLTRAVITDIVDKESINRLLSAGLVVVRIDYYQNLPLDNVVQDNFGGIQLAMEHFFSLNLDKVAFISSYKSLLEVDATYNVDLRLGGYLLALQRKYGNDSGKTIIDLDYFKPDYEGAAKVIVQSNVQAFIIPHKFWWKPLKDCLASKGWKYQENYQVIVWGDPEPDEVESFPPYITWDKEAMGREGVRRVFERLSCNEISPATILIPTRLENV